MPFLGKTPTVGNFILLDSITVSNTATFALTKDTLDYYPGSAQNMIVSVNGVTQAPLTAYTITDNNIVFASALNSDSDVIDYILVLGDTLNIGRPSDSTVGATQLQDYAVTSVKMSNTGVGAATYGTSTSIPQITIDAAGRITSATGVDRSNQFEDLTVTGNLTVSGNTVTVDAQTLSVEDPLIHLAANNETSDVVDIGFVGHYSNDGGTTKLHTGFFRDASDEQYYLFNGFEDATLDLSSPSTTIDRTANTFTLADLNTGRLYATVDSNIAASFTSTTTTAKITIVDANDTAVIDVNATRLGIGHSSSTSLQALQIEPTSAEAMRIANNGYVGIGTDNPIYTLDVTETSGAGIRIHNTTDSIATLYLRNTGTSDGSITQEGGDMFFQIAGDKKIELRNDGNFGIGRLNPDARLTVDTDQQLIARLASSNTGITGVRLEGIDTSATDNVYVDWFYDAENRQYGFGEGTASGSLPINSGITYADIIVNAGNVRIPSEVGLSALSVTTNPLTLGNLTSFNLAFDSNEIQARNNGVSNNLLLNKNGGNVGIGWAGHGAMALLDIFQVTGDDIRISASSSDYWGINAGNYFTINDSGTLRLRIYDDGKTILGDDVTPETLLHLADTDTSSYSISETGLNSYTPKGGDLLQVQNRSAGTDDVYAGIWFETGNPATNTTGTNRSGRFALVPQNDAAYGSNFVWQLRTTDASLNEYMRLSYKGHLRVPAKVHFGMPQADIADDTNPGARLRVDHNQGTPDEAPVVWIERQNNLASPGKPEAALYIKDHQSNYPFVIRDHNDTNIFSILGDGRIESYPVDTDLTAGRNYFFMDVNVNTSEAQWTGVDYTKSGIFVDMDASGTGGNTTDELRLYAIRGDCRSTHQTADLVCGLYGYAEAQHSTGTTTNTYGVYGYAVGDDTGTGRSQSVFGGHFLSYAYASGTGGTNTHYAVYGKTLLTTAADKDHTSVYGSRFEIEIDNPGQAQSVTTAYVVAAEFDNDSAGNVSIGTSYLYYGNYAGTLPTNAYGLYILDSVDNYLAGDLDVAGTKNFQIKHPLPSLANTHNLVHTVIEGPSADNMYNGMVRLVNGSATINIDTEFGMTEGTFVALNRNIRRSVTNEEGFTAVKCSLNGNILTITAQDNTCTDEVFWMVIGQRQDQEIKASTKTDANGYLILEPEQVEHVRPEKVQVEDTRDIN